MKQLSIEDGRHHPNPLAAAPAAAAASAPPPAPPTINEPVQSAVFARPPRGTEISWQGSSGTRRRRSRSLRPHGPRFAAARGLITVNSATAQIKRKLGLNATSKPLPESAYKVRRAAGKGKVAGSLAAKRAAVGAGDDTDHSEGDS
ncbi:hypothetical protein DL768_004132 [Monosporascus sp. mg162]|nr:hypothetical protein DL768_004132 [Monosporascus sp. mg162]